MQNNYLLEGESFFEINKEIQRIIDTKNFKEATISNYDLIENDIKEVLEDLDTYSFLSDKKVILLTNIEVINSDEYKKDLDHLYKYLENPNPDNLLFIWGTKFNNVLKVTKELKKKCEVIDVTIDPVKYIKSELSGYKISSQNIEYLMTKCLNDISSIQNEVSKLKNYKDDKEITKKDIDDIVVEKLGDSTELTFTFSRALAEKDKKKAFEAYNKLLSYNVDALSIIGLLASQIRIIYQVKVLERDRLSADEIAKTLGEKPFRVKKTKELTRYYTEKELLDLMIQLSDMDVKVKSTDISPNDLIELFILNV